MSFNDSSPIWLTDEMKIVGTALGNNGSISAFSSSSNKSDFVTARSLLLSSNSGLYFLVH